MRITVRARKRIPITNASAILRRKSARRHILAPPEKRESLPPSPRDGDYCGIYVITNILTGECYVGQSVGILGRFRQHITTLRCGGGGWKMRETYEAHGEGALRLSVAELCQP